MRKTLTKRHTSYSLMEKRIKKDYTVNCMSFVIRTNRLYLKRFSSRPTSGHSARNMIKNAKEEYSRG